MQKPRRSAYDSRLVGRWPIAGLALFWACTATETPVFLDLGQLDRELVLLASLDAEGRTLQGALFDWSQEPLSTSLLPVPTDGRLVGVAFDRAELLARSPRLDQTRLDALAFEGRNDAAESCAEGLLDASRGRTLIGWPSGARAFELDADEARLADRVLTEEWFASVLLSTPVTIDRCNGHPEVRLRPFAPRMPILERGSVINGVPSLLEKATMGEFVRVDEERALLTYANFLIVAERGVGFVDEPGRSIDIGAEWITRSFSVGPPRPGSGIRRVIVVSVNGDTLPEVTRSRLSETTLDGWTLGPVRTILESETTFDAVHIRTDDERFILFEKPGLFHQEQTVGGNLEVVGDFNDQLFAVDKRARLVTAGPPSHPFALLGAGPNTIFIGRNDGLEWLSLQQGLTTGLTLRAFAALSGTNEEPQLYAGNTTGHAFQKKFSDRAWERIHPRLDPALAPLSCAELDPSSPCGFAIPKVAWQHFSVFADHAGQPALFAFSDLCSIAFVLRPDGCTSSVILDELGAVGRLTFDEIYAGQSAAGFLTLGTESGNLYELEWSALGLEQ